MKREVVSKVYERMELIKSGVIDYTNGKPTTREAARQDKCFVQTSEQKELVDQQMNSRQQTIQQMQKAGSPWREWKASGQAVPEKTKIDSMKYQQQCKLEKQQLDQLISEQQSKLRDNLQRDQTFNQAQNDNYFPDQNAINVINSQKQHARAFNCSPSRYKSLTLVEENNILERGQRPLDTKLIAQYSRLSMGSPSRTVTPAYCAAINENVRRYERRTKTAMSPTRVEY